ncbi:hypothetical protein O3G_MSEX001574 [Manduca sexta]|uniref:Ribonuclease 3 n=1 Tax=Manduca sexta TaxID=7130 RepID=A0A922CCH0_MANSE|nr:hypothetical protein O3G_MSEX001574 [Manduca sexta]
MSIPPINYSVPPPSLNMPPPVSPHHVSPATSNPNFYNHPPPLYHMPALQHADQSPYVAMASLPQFDVPPHVYPAYSDPLDVSQPTPHYYPPPVSNEYMYQNPEDYKNQDPQWYNSSGIDNGDLMAAPSTSKCIPRINERSSSTERYRYQYSSKEYLSKHRYSPGRSHSYEYRDYRDHDRYRDREREFDGEGRRDRYREIERERRRDRDREMERDRSRDYRYRSRSPTYHSHHGRSPSRSSTRDREAYYREKERYKEKEEYERRRYEYERYRSMSRYSSYRSHSRSCDSRASVRPRRSRSRNKRSCSRESYRPSRTREMSHYSHKNVPPKPMSDREKILEEYRKNYCQTSEDFIQKMEQWSKEHSVEEEEGPKMWYRSSPAELYYKPVEGGTGVQQTSKLEKLCEKFYTKLIERGRNARPEVDELPPLKTPKAKTCMHTNSQDDKKMTSSSSYLDEEGFEGFTDRIMLELQRKQSHPRRLHPEMWFNSTGEMNGGPLCRCSAKARRYGMRHGVYAGEETFPKCNPLQNNIDKLYHYRITVSPPTNFLIKAPTIIGHDEHEFLFSGFSMFSHYKLAKLPMCKVIRFNIEYTILYVEEPAPQNFTIKELDLFEEFLFYELLELVDLDLGKATDTTCSQFHFLPRFVRYLPEGGCEVLSMCEVIKYLIDESGLLIPPETLSDVHEMDHYTWQKFVDRIKGMIVTYPGKKPCSVRVDQLDRSPPTGESKHTKETKKFYPEIVHFGIRPPQLSYAGNPEYQRAWRYYVKYRHLIANMAKPSFNERQKLAAKEAQLQEIRMQNKMKRDVTVAMSSEGFHTTGLMCDVVQHAMLIPVLVRHLRFHKSLNTLEEKIGYVFKQRALLQTALTHPSYRENFGTNPDHARNSLTNCGIRQPEYGDRRIHYTRKKGIVTLINIMSRFGKNRETESEMKHNERLEFLGDAVVEFLSSIHLFKMFPGLAEGGLATYRAAIVQNQHLAQLARNIELEQFMLYAHGSDLCRDVVMRHAMANSFEALMGALFLDAGLQDRVFSLALWYNEPMLHEAWTKERLHPLQEQEPLGDRKYIKDFEFLQRLTEFEDSIGIVTLINIMSRFGKNRETESEMKHNERLEFLGDAVVEFLSSIHLFKMFPGLAEGGLATYRAAIVQNQHLAQLARNIELEQFMLYAHGSDLCRDVVMRHAMANSFEALMGALFLDAGLQVADRVFSLALWYNEPMLHEAWTKERLHPLQEQEPLGDRKYIKDFEFLQRLTEFEDSIGVQFKHIRLLARAFTDRSVGFTHLTLGSNQRLEFLGDTVLQLVVSDRLYRHFPDHHEGHLSFKHIRLLARAFTDRSVGFTHLTLGSNQRLEFLGDTVLQLVVSDRLYRHFPDHHEGHLSFKHIRLLARAFTDRSVGFTHLTLGSNQRLEFLGDTVLQLVVSDRLYRHFPDHHEGHLSLLRSSLVNNRTQSMVCDDLNMSAYAIYNNPKAKPTTKKHKADLLEAFLGALFIDKNLEYCQAFCNACLFPRLQEFIMNQDWNDPKSKLQQCCLTLRSVEGGEPDIPVYKVIECLGPTNTRVYTVGVYFRGARLAAARGHSIQEAEMNAAEQALNSSHGKLYSIPIATRACTVYTVGVYFRGARLAAARGHSIQEAEMNAAEQALNSSHGKLYSIPIATRARTVYTVGVTVPTIGSPEEIDSKELKKEKPSRQRA